MGTGSRYWVSELSSFSSSWDSRSKTGIQGYWVLMHEVPGRRQSFCSFHELHLALLLKSGISPLKTSVPAEAEQAGWGSKPVTLKLRDLWPEFY